MYACVGFIILIRSMMFLLERSECCLDINFHPTFVVCCINLALYGRHPRESNSFNDNRLLEEMHLPHHDIELLCEKNESAIILSGKTFRAIFTISPFN